MVAVISVDVRPFLAFSGLSCHLENMGIGVQFCTYACWTKKYYILFSFCVCVFFFFFFVCFSAFCIYIYIKVICKFLFFKKKVFSGCTQGVFWFHLIARRPNLEVATKRLLHQQVKILG